MILDINSDLGEDESASRTRALMRCVTSANIACGGHAGTLHSMEACVRLALEHGVRIGAHPGFRGSGDFGRSMRRIAKDEIAHLLVQQVGALKVVAEANGAAVHHIKLHGALYHLIESGVGFATTYVETIARYWPGLRIYAFAGGNVITAAARAGIEAWGEVFAERGYLDSGRLVPRVHDNALVTSRKAAGERLRRLLLYGEILSVNGKPLKVAASTICVHSDTPNAVAIARMLKGKLLEDGVRRVPGLPQIAQS